MGDACCNLPSEVVKRRNIQLTGATEAVFSISPLSLASSSIQLPKFSAYTVQLVKAYGLLRLFKGTDNCIMIVIY